MRLFERRQWWERQSNGAVKLRQSKLAWLPKLPKPVGLKILKILTQHQVIQHSSHWLATDLLLFPGSSEVSIGLYVHNGWQMAVPFFPHRCWFASNAIFLTSHSWEAQVISPTHSFTSPNKDTSSYPKKMLITNDTPEKNDYNSITRHTKSPPSVASRALVSSSTAIPWSSTETPWAWVISEDLVNMLG